MGVRVVPFTPVPGKSGSITVSGIGALNLAEWEPTQNAAELETTNFNSPTDPNGNVHEEFQVGTVNTKFTVSGVRDQGAQRWNPTAGATGTATLLYAPNFGFTFSFIVTDVGGGQKVKDQAMFTVTLRATGLCTMTGA